MIGLRGIPVQQLSGVVILGGSGACPCVSLGNAAAADPTMALTKAAAEKGTGDIEKNFSKDSPFWNILKSWSGGPAENTTPFPPGYIPFWKYFPAQPNYGKPVSTEPTNIAFARSWEKATRPEWSPSGIPDISTANALFIQYGSQVISEAKYASGSFDSFWKEVYKKYQADLKLVNPNNGGGSPNSDGSFPGDLNDKGGLSMASTGLFAGLVLILIAIGSRLKSKPATKKEEEK